MNKTVTLIVFAALLTLTGCNSIRPIGTIGDVEYMAVRTTDVSGPNALIIVTVGPDGTQNAASYGGDGVLNSLVSAGGSVVAADVLSVGDVNTTTTVQTKYPSRIRNPIQPSPGRP